MNYMKEELEIMKENEEGMLKNSGTQEKDKIQRISNIIYCKIG